MGTRIASSGHGPNGDPGRSTGVEPMTEDVAGLSASDHLAIQQLIATYYQSFDGIADDAARTYAHTFTQSGTLEVLLPSGPWLRASGRDELERFAARMITERSPRAYHWAANSVTIGSPDGRSARHTCYLMSLRERTSDGGGQVGTTGVYRDQLVKRDGRWYFECRVLTLDDDSLRDRGTSGSF